MRTTTTTNAGLLHALSEQVENLSCGTAKNQFPVLLGPIAKRRRVTSVEFLPLLVDAMLTTHPKGFRILFNSNGEDPAGLNQQFELENPSQLMPSRTRFSLAHEIAHTLFYDLSDETPVVAKRFRSGGGKTELENLERNCNRLAAEMLLPGPMLRAAFREFKAVTPSELVGLAGKAGVAIQTLVRRLGERGGFPSEPHFRGCILLVTEAGNDANIYSVARPKGLNIARELLSMRSGERLQLTDADGRQMSRQKLAEAAEVSLVVETTQDSWKQQYRVEQIEVRRVSGNPTFLLTFEEIEKE